MIFHFIVNGVHIPLKVEDEEMVYCLQNDETYTRNYIRHLLESNDLLQFGLDPRDSSNLSIQLCEVVTPTLESDETSSTILEAQEVQDRNYEDSVTQVPLWSTGKASQQDHEATIKLLELRASAKFHKLFSNTKSSEANLWQRIANELPKEYFLGDSLTAKGVKCRQRFANLEQSYIEFVRYVKKRGEEHNPPPYYELLHNILGNKHKVHPIVTSDTLNIKGSSLIPHTLLRDIQKTEHIHSTTSQHHSVTLPPSTSFQQPGRNRFTHLQDTDLTMIDTLEKMHKQTMDFFNKRFEFLDKQIQLKNKQRQRMHQLLETVVKSMRRKR